MLEYEPPGIPGRGENVRNWRHREIVAAFAPLDVTAAVAQADCLELIAHRWEDGISEFARAMRDAQAPWSGAAAAAADAALSAYLAEARELSTALVELSGAVRAAAEAIVTTRCAIPELVATEMGDGAAEYGAQETALETARTAMHERYVLPFGAVDRRIPVLPMPTRRAVALPDGRWASGAEEGRSSAALVGSPKGRSTAEGRPGDRDGGDDRPGGGRGSLDRPEDSDGDDRPHERRDGDDRPHDSRGNDDRPHDSRDDHDRPHDSRDDHDRPHNCRDDDDRPGDSGGDDRPQLAGGGPRDDRVGEERVSADADSQGLIAGQEAHEGSDSTDLAASGSGPTTMADNSTGAITMEDNGTGPTAKETNGSGRTEIEGSGTSATREVGQVEGGPGDPGAQGSQSPEQAAGEPVVRAVSSNAGVAPLSPLASGFGPPGGTTPLPSPSTEPGSGWFGERPGRQDLSRDVRQDLAAGGTSATGSGERAWAGGPRYRPSPPSDPLEPGIGRSVPGAAGPVIGANPSSEVSAPRILDRLFHCAVPPAAGQAPDPEHERALPDYLITAANTEALLGDRCPTVTGGVIGGEKPALDGEQRSPSARV
ncbi:hypothetical protein [Nocardia asteroides]|uniref:hypothetical protein n=1 Tax=Nocardia asteroides TaxID=1824 RepID=UPI001E4B659C|nr:hypothetical protein [Nocardia asteroides]UGT54174.1 hypothetical protein LTT85_26555 [Nocardia asteroides]